MAAQPWLPGAVVFQEGYNAATRKLIEVRPAFVRGARDTARPAP